MPTPRGEPIDHRWSWTAATIGFVFAIALTIPTDIEPNTIVGLLCPPFVIVAGILRLAKLNGLPSIVYPVFVLLVAVGNAFWFMLITETLRVAIAKLRTGKGR